MEVPPSQLWNHRTVLDEEILSLHFWEPLKSNREWETSLVRYLRCLVRGVLMWIKCFWQSRLQVQKSQDFPPLQSYAKGCRMSLEVAEGAWLAGGEIHSNDQ